MPRFVSKGFLVQYRPLGKTDAHVSVLSFEASPTGETSGRVSREECAATVRAAVEAGVNFFDVSAPDEDAETALGQALEGRRERVYLSTRTGRTPNGFDFSKSGIAQNVEESLRRLKTDHLDFLFLQDIEFGDLNQVFEEGCDALSKLKAQGKCRWIGMSGYPLSVLRQAMEACELDVFLTAAHFCLCDITVGKELAPFARNREVGLINAAPLAMGLLTEGGPPPGHPAPPELIQATSEAADACRAYGSSLAHLALQYAFLLPLITTEERPVVTTTLVETATREQLERNLHAFNDPLDWDLLVEVQDIFMPVMNIPFPIGRPENRDPAIWKE